MPGKDEYANLVFDEVTESVVNTLTFESIDLGLTILQKVALLIHSVEYTDFWGYLAAAGDSVIFGLAASNSFATPSPAERSIITFQNRTMVDYGTAGNNIVWTEPVKEDFSTFPGGGLLVVPKPLFLFVKGANLATPAHVTVRIYFTIKELKDAEYLELLETRAYFG